MQSSRNNRFRLGKKIFMKFSDSFAISDFPLQSRIKINFHFLEKKFPLHHCLKWKVRDFPTSDTANLLCVLFIVKRKEKDSNWATKNESVKISFAWCFTCPFHRSEIASETSWRKNLLTQKLLFRCEWNAFRSKDTKSLLADGTCRCNLWKLRKLKFIHSTDPPQATADK